MRLHLSALAVLALFSASPALAASDLALINRLSWGETGQGDTLGGQSAQAWLEQQLHPSSDDGLPPQVQAQIDAMEISQKSLPQINDEVRELREQAQRAKGSPGYDAVQKIYQQKLQQLMQEAQTRSLLRDLYSKNQLKEQLTWFWFNHFNVHAQKAEIRAFVGDYENTIRAHALGKFRDLLQATAVHPAMLQYLDNAQNAAAHINENYAREIMELHTLGVGSGYSQQDVQELARIFTGLGVAQLQNPPKIRPELQGQYIRDGLFEFNPNRHDYGNKVLLGRQIAGRGLSESDEAVGILCRAPATAHFISKKLAVYFASEDPPQALLDAMTDTFRKSDGDIAAVLKT